MRKKIMLVDDSITNLATGKSALQNTYDVLTVPSGERALALLEKTKPDLILLDVDMPGMNGYSVITSIKGNKATAHIPVVFLTAKDDAESEYYGLSLGAVDYIAKPFSVPLLLKRIELHLLIEDQNRRLLDYNRQLHDYNENLQKMVDEKTEKIVTLQDAILSTFAEMVEFRDDTTGGHIERTQLYLKALLEEMIKRGLYSAESAGWDAPLLVQSAQLHDVGKISIPDDILKKPGKLTEAEFGIMKHHTTLGKKAIDQISQKVDESEFLQQAAILAYSHHERWDGTGYPLGLAGENIPLQGRLMAISDVYDALVSERPYKKPYSHERAAGIILDGSGTQFDPVLVNIFDGVSEVFREISKGNTKW